MRNGSLSPLRAASSAATLMLEPVATIRDLSRDNATQTPAGASFNTHLRSRG